MFFSLLRLYGPLFGWIACGYLLGRWLPASAPNRLGKFLFWIGTPIGIIAFLRHAQISAYLWLAPATAWLAIFSSLGIAWWASRGLNQRSTQGSFLLTSMFGNTGYIGFPVSLTLVGQATFTWAVFYDLLGSTLGAYGLGVLLAARFGDRAARWQEFLQAMVTNPVLWSFAFGLMVRDAPLPVPLETVLQGLAWGAVSLSLVLVGMRLSRLRSLTYVRPALLSVSIKMLLIPLLLGLGLRQLGIDGSVHQALLLQLAMPPAFASLVISETYDLDPDYAVTAIAIGCLFLFVSLPIWLWLFGSP